MSMPRRSATSVAQVRVVASSRPVVDALVTSATRTPGEPVAEQVRDEQQAPGVREGAVPCAATSWNTVLNGCTCRPERAYSSAAGIVAKTFSGTPSVRASR